jgi:hypothetical protein
MSDQVDVETVPVESSEASAKSRLGWLLHSTRGWLILLVLLVLAGIIVGVSYAAFTSTSANAGNVVAAGSLIIDDDLDNGAILVVEGLAPGETATGTVTISNVGESSGDFTLSQTGYTSTPGLNGGDLGTVLQLEITEDATTVVYSGLFSALSTVDLGNWAAGDDHTYVFEVTFPSGANDNSYQGSQVTTTYVWDAVAG